MSLWLILPPDGIGEQGGPEAAVVGFDQRIGGAPFEHRIHRIERPGLIEKNAVVEEIRAVKHHALVVQKPQQRFRRTHASNLFAEAGEIRLAEGAVQALRGRQLLIGLAPGLQLLPHQVAAPADAADAIAIPQVGVGIGQGLLEAGGAAPGAGAEVADAQAAEAFQQGRIHRQHGHRLGGGVALALHNHHRGVGAAEGAHIIEPVGERVAALQGIVVVVAGHQGFLLRRPEHHKHRRSAHKQGVGAVVDVLAAEIPDVVGGIPI